MKNNSNLGININQSTIPIFYQYSFYANNISYFCLSQPNQ